MYDLVTCWEGHKICTLPEVSVLDGGGLEGLLRMTNTSRPGGHGGAPE